VEGDSIWGETLSSLTQTMDHYICVVGTFWSLCDKRSAWDVQVFPFLGHSGPHFYIYTTLLRQTGSHKTKIIQQNSKFLQKFLRGCQINPCSSVSATVVSFTPSTSSYIALITAAAASEQFKLHCRSQLSQRIDLHNYSHHLKYHLISTFSQQCQCMANTR